MKPSCLIFSVFLEFNFVHIMSIVDEVNFVSKFYRWSMFFLLLSSFSLGLTAKKALERSKKCDIPYAWDDPSSKDDVKFTVQALFNQVYYSD